MMYTVLHNYMSSMAELYQTIEEAQLELIFQGAEAKVYSCNLKNETVIIKERLSKRYRIPELDLRINKQRLLQESRCIEKCKKAGVSAPRLVYTDMAKYRLIMEKIDGITLKEFLFLNKSDEGKCNSVMKKVGIMLGKMHDAEITHGDLTTSNLMLRNVAEDFEVVLIDFGLGSMKPSVEDKAVDLYVLERAFISTHPESESLMSELIEAYRFGCRKGTIILSRLLQVRARGRKRDMAG